MNVIIIIVVLIVILLFFYGYYGGFKKIRPIIKQVGGEYIVYRSVKGDYKNSGKYSDEVYYYLKNDLSINTYKGLGIYYDNPKEVKAEDLRSDIGCILEESDYSKLEEIKKHYEVKQLETKDYLTAEFPFKGKLSSIFGILKVYPKLNEGSGPVMEIWDIPNNKILYRKEI